MKDSLIIEELVLDVGGKETIRPKSQSTEYRY